MLEVDAKLTDGNVTAKILFVHTSKGAQEIADSRPHPLDSVDVHFANPVTIIITCPFFLAVTDRCVRSDDMVVTLPFICVYLCTSQSESMHVLNQGFLVRVMNHTQTHLPTLTTDCADHRWTVVVICAVTALFVCPPSRKVFRIWMKLSFFPPRSETSRPFQSLDLASNLVVVAVLRWLVYLCVCREAFGDIRLSRVQGLTLVRLCICHEVVSLLVLVESAFPQTRFHYIGCRCLDNACTGTRSTDSCLSCETRVPPPRLYRSAGTSIGFDGSTSAAKLCSNHHLASLRLVSPY